MKKFLLPCLFLLSYLPSQASWFLKNKVELDTVVLDSVVIPSENKIRKCIGATALLLGTLSGIEDIKDEDNTKTTFQGLQVLQKRPESRQAAKDLYDAIDKCDYNLAIRLLKDKPYLDINARFICSCTALMWCCIRGDESINVVKHILKHPNLDITIKNCYGATCLHYACSWGRPKITSLLLKREDIGKILNAKDCWLEMPLDSIVCKVRDSRARIGHITIWNMMVAKGAQLSRYKEDYKQLDSDKFKPPYSDYVDILKSQPT